MTGQNIEPEFIKTTKQYVLMVESIINRINKTKPKDRLDYVVATKYLLEALTGSLTGWMQWVGNIEHINSLNIKDWKEIHPEMVKLSTAWFKLDLNITKKKIVEASAKLKKNRKKLKKSPSKKKKSTYVA